MNDKKLETLAENLENLLEQLHKLKSKPIDVEFEEVKEEELKQAQKNTPAMGVLKSESSNNP